MSFLKKMIARLTGPAFTPDFHTFQVRCQRCGEIIEGRLNINNDLSIQYEDGTAYIGRKVLMGSGLCFQQIEVNFKFSGEKELLEKTISGGEFIEK